MEVGAEKVNPYSGDQREKGAQVREMFDRIAPAYDFMNRMMTFGVDKRWRRKAVRLVANSPQVTQQSEPRILDIATGTGDLAIALSRAIPKAHITGIDLSEGMLEIGRRKVTEHGLANRIELLCADCLEMPFPDNTFDCITVAYGVRNFQCLADGYREMARVLRPGGLLCVIELSTPSSSLIRPFYNFYTKYIIPAAGRMVSHDVSAYAYLPQSIAAVPQGERMVELIEESGLDKGTSRPLTFGVCSIYTANKTTN